MNDLVMSRMLVLSLVSIALVNLPQSAYCQLPSFSDLSDLSGTISAEAVQSSTSRTLPVTSSPIDTGTVFSSISPTSGVNGLNTDLLTSFHTSSSGLLTSFKSSPTLSIEETSQVVEQSSFSTYQSSGSTLRPSLTSPVTSSSHFIQASSMTGASELQQLSSATLLTETLATSGVSLPLSTVGSSYEPSTTVSRTVSSISFTSSSNVTAEPNETGSLSFVLSTQTPQVTSSDTISSMVSDSSFPTTGSQTNTININFSQTDSYIPSRSQSPMGTSDVMSSTDVDISYSVTAASSTNELTSSMPVISPTFSSVFVTSLATDASVEMWSTTPIIVDPSVETVLSTSLDSLRPTSSVSPTSALYDTSHTLMSTGHNNTTIALIPSPTIVTTMLSTATTLSVIISPSSTKNFISSSSYIGIEITSKPPGRIPEKFRDRRFLLVFTGDCKFLLGNENYKGEFQFKIRREISTELQIVLWRVDVERIFCGSVKVHVTLRNISSASVGLLTTLVNDRRLNITVGVPPGARSLVASRVMQISLKDDKPVSKDPVAPRFHVSKTDMVAIIVCSLLILCIVAIGVTACVRKHRHHKQRHSYNLRGRAHTHMRFQDYALSRMARPKSLYADIDPIPGYHTTPSNCGTLLVRPTSIAQYSDVSVTNLPYSREALTDTDSDQYLHHRRSVSDHVYEHHGVGDATFRYPPDAPSAFDHPYGNINPVFTPDVNDGDDESIRYMSTDIVNI